MKNKKNNGIKLSELNYTFKDGGGIQTDKIIGEIKYGDGNVRDIRLAICQEKTKFFHLSRKVQGFSVFYKNKFEKFVSYSTLIDRLKGTANTSNWLLDTCVDQDGGNGFYKLKAKEILKRINKKEPIEDLVKDHYFTQIGLDI